MKVYYIENDKTVPIFNGDFKECLEFYINNKAEYRKRNKYIQVGK